MEHNTNVFTHAGVEQFVNRVYGFRGETHFLYGESDLNFKIDTEDQAYVLKITQSDALTPHLSFQKNILLHIRQQQTDLLFPTLVQTKNREYYDKIIDSKGQKHVAYMLRWIDGVLWADINPITSQLRNQLGKSAGQLTTLLSNFRSDWSPQQSVWDIAQSLWTKDMRGYFTTTEWEHLDYFIQRFESIQPKYIQLRKGYIHNDVNDHNVLVDSKTRSKIVSIIDFGDALHSQVVNDVAIACCYAIFNTNNPLEAALEVVRGYHSSCALNEQELEVLYTCIGMRLVNSLCHSAINKRKQPENTYLQISEKPARDLLSKWKDIQSDFALYAFRHSCQLEAHPQAIAFYRWSKTAQYAINDLFPKTSAKSVVHLDLSVSSTWLGHRQDFNNLEYFQFKLDEFKKKHNNAIPTGGYLEPRPIYTSDTYGRRGNRGKESRTVHLGVDFWLPAYTPVHALLDGEVVISTNDAGYKEYGGLLVLKHTVEDLTFYTLYGHLSVESALNQPKGTILRKGEKIALLGDPKENGEWASHLHFQIMLSLLDYKDDFPGVAYHSELDIWKGLCPDPNLLFKLPELEQKPISTSSELLAIRKRSLGSNLSLSYSEPLHIVRGEGVYLLDPTGRKYLDTINNVAHVGHENYDVIAAARHQMTLLNTNTRYLHDNIIKLAEQLKETLPTALEVVYFVNSGSEANELALRMVESHTRSKHMLVSEVGYHGNTARCIEVSSYKFDGKGGEGKPQHTHVFPIPDAFRGKYRGGDCSNHYVTEVERIIQDLSKSGIQLGGLILEPILSCGGQIELPDTFLSQVYTLVRNAGGVCISDEVQVGCGRLGSHFWGFEQHDVVPDIITIGKPLGNGHPIGAVVCTKDIAQSFSNGMEYFNTFGGNPVSCATASQVLRTIKKENLQSHAQQVGQKFKEQLVNLSNQYPIIGNVRGQGLFLGFELVDEQLRPLPRHASYLVNRMKYYGVLMSTDGKDENVIKIKPPIIFSSENMRDVIYYLSLVFAEDAMR